MKYYKTQNGIRAIGEKNDNSGLGDQTHLVQDDWALMTDEEVDSFLNPPKTDEEILIEQHEQKSNLVDEYVNNLIITTTSNKRFKARYSDLSSMDIILKSDYPNGVIPIWKQNINGELVYYENLPLSELSEVINEANKRIQAKHAEIFLNIENPYNEVENEIQG